MKITRFQLEADIQLDFNLLVGPGDFPGIVVAEPVVGVLLLPSIHDRLFEHAVLVAQTIACGWKLHRGHRIQEACCEPAQATIAKTRVWFLLDQFKPVDTFFLDRMLYNRIKQEVGNIVGQRTPDEKFHGEVINALGIRSIISLLSLHPALREDVSYRTGERFKAFTRTRHFRVDHSVKKQMAFVKRVFRSDKWSRAASIVMQKF